MPSTTGDASRPITRPLTFPIARSSLAYLGDLLATGVLPFALILYLGLKGGGYDAIVRSEVGIAAWWIVLVGGVAGLLPMRSLPRWSIAALAALLAFAVWTAIGIGWSESAERSVAEVSRVLALLGVLAVALALQRPGGLRRTVGGAAAAIALIGLLALGSRLHPSWFPDNETAEFLGAAESRLNWPLNYWNGLAALLAMGIPLLLALSTAARTVLVRGASAAAVPALALAAFFTLSRGGVAELAVALVVLFAFSVNRAGSLPTWILAGGGSAILIAAATQRDALTDGLQTEAALSQGDDVLILTLITCLAVGLLVLAFNLGHRSGLTPMIRIPRTASRAAVAVTALAAVVAFFALGGPGEADEAFTEFKDPDRLAGSDVSRFESVNGSNRWQIWSSAVDANESAPLIGIGPGTFEFWWAENGTTDGGFLRDAHSLYLETLGELGVVGLVLLLAVLIAAFLGCGSRLRTTPHGDRKLLAGVLAAMAAFLVAAAIDWVWELTVLPVTFLLLAAAGALGYRRPAGDRSSSPRPLSAPSRIALGIAAIAAIGWIVVPLASTQEIRASQEAAAASALPQALSSARTAEDIEPYAGTPALQRALVLERDGRLASAASAATEATEAEPTNWRPWFVLARVEAARGEVEASLATFERARELNPKSSIFTAP